MPSVALFQPVGGKKTSLISIQERDLQIGGNLFLDVVPTSGDDETAGIVRDVARKFATDFFGLRILPSP
jgi:hypothetical protein